MARRKATEARTRPDVEERIVDIDVSNEMEASFLEYAYSVIYARALPDARDGLKPVQRRILFQMDDMGLRPDRPYVKSARVVGEVMGKLHPHGDQAIYDALVRQAQWFSLRLPLVDGHGNFGSLDDGPAAARYTEARLAPAAMAMVRDLGEDVVNLIPNYDNKLLQPEVLPAAIPNLLVNGATGIAVGMATNMAPHNLIEVAAAAQHLIRHPDASLDELMRFVPGPDLPSGGRIVGLDEIREAYRSGRGKFRTRASVSIESVSPRRQGIVVTELPYLVGPEKVIEKIKDGVQAKKIQGVSAVTDLSDRQHGLRLVIEIKNGFNPEAVLEQLYRYTPLEDSFGINNVALVDGQPRTLGLKELLEVWVNHRVDVTRRRTEYRLARRNERLHLVDGLLIAIVDIDEVIQVIRTSDDAETARTRLQDIFDLSQLQADYILELRLRRLTKFSRIELEKEQSELQREIAYLTELLGDKNQLLDLVSAEIGEAAREHGTPRRTVLLESDGGAATTSAAKKSTTPLEIADGPCRVLLSTTGLIARTGDDQPIVREGDRSAHDALLSDIDAQIRGDVGAVTSAGRLVRLSVLDLPALPPVQGPPGLSGGAPVDALISLDRDEHVVGLASLAPDAAPLAIGSEQGVVKRVLTSDAPSSKDEWEIISLRDGDSIVGIGHVSDADEIVFVSSDASLLRFAASAVRVQGRSAAGMAGIKLAAGARAIGFNVVSQSDDADATESVVVTVAGASDALPGTVPGSAKVTPFAAFPAKGRATGGVRAQRFLRGEDCLTTAWVGPAPARGVGSAGQPVDLPELDQRRDGSGVALPSVLGGIG